MCPGGSFASWLNAELMPESISSQPQLQKTEQLMKLLAPQLKHHPEIILTIYKLLEVNNF